jgi:hypothetical protein
MSERLAVSAHGDSGDERSAGELALGSLLDAASAMHPDHLAGTVRRAADGVGLHDATIYVVDKRQVVLTPLPEFGGVPLPIDTTPAGRCFRDTAVVAERDGDRIELWFPVMSGASRVGVLGTTTDRDDAVRRDRGRQLAVVAGGLLDIGSNHGDNLVNAGRTKPMSLAAEIRWALVPPLTFRTDDVVIAGFLEPAYDIAGDTFDYAVNDQGVHLAIIDAVGHGMEASRIANLALLSYRHSRRLGLALDETYLAMDAAIATAFDRSAYATAQLATFDLRDGRLRWINAGHPPPLLFRPGRDAVEITGDPITPVGLGTFPGDVHEVALEAGDVVALYTDGITEARSPDGTRFGVDRLGSLMRQGIDERIDPPELVRQVVHRVVEHERGQVTDDATLLILEWLLPG